MDSELINEALVYGLDNPDPMGLELGDEDILQNYSQSVLACIGVNDSQSVVRLDKTIDVSMEKAEIEKLRNELLRIKELNRTITTSYNQLLVNNFERTPQKSDSKRKMCILLQEELEEKTIVCQKVTSKMNNYKRKYQALRATLVKGSETNSSVDNRDSQVAFVEKENAELKKQISAFKENEAEWEDKPKHSESKMQSLSNVQCLLGNSLLVEKIKAKGGIFSHDAGKVVSSISKLKELIDDLVGSTPSTNWIEDEGLNIDLPQRLDLIDDVVLGKRDCILDSSPHNDGVDEIMDDIMFELKPAPPQEASQSQKIFEQHLRSGNGVSSPEEALQRETKKPFKVDNGSSDDEEESSLTYEDTTIHLIDKKLGQLAKRGHKSALYYGSEPFKRQIVEKLSPQRLLEKYDSEDSFTGRKSTALIDHNSKSMIVETPTPVTETVHKVHKPMLPLFEATTVCHKTTIPSFLIMPSSAELQLNKQVASDTNSRAVGTSQNLQFVHQKPSESTRISLEDFLRDVSQYLDSFKIGASNLDKQKSEFISILKSFRKHTSSMLQSSRKQDRKSLLELLLQKESNTETYLLKEVLKGQSSPSDSNRVYQLFVFQNLFFIIFISCFSEDTLKSEEQENAAYFLGFRNPSPVLAEKFDKLCEIVTSAKAKAGQTTASSAGERGEKGFEKRYSHHFPLIKIVFNHLIYIMESVVVPCHTEDDFCSAVLAKKMNLGELKDSCHYVVEKLARTPLQFDFLADLPDYLSSLRLLFLFARSINFNMSRIYYDGLRGVFANRKYRNSAQQLTACLILRQLNSLDHSN